MIPNIVAANIAIATMTPMAILALALVLKPPDGVRIGSREIQGGTFEYAGLQGGKKRVELRKHVVSSTNEGPTKNCII